MSTPTPSTAPRPEPVEGTISRREALRRTVVFSTAALVGGRTNILRARPVETKFADRGIHLLALGDYGSKNENQVAVANAMAKFAKSLNQPLTAVLALGDNFYKKLTLERFDTHFEKMYSTDGLDCPFHVCLGNHDYGEALYDFQQGKARMQIDYAKNNPESRWKLPAKWYTVELPSADKPLVKIIVLDGNYWPGALTPKEKIEQRHFLEAELKKKTDASWLWLVNHFPLFSDCKKRGDSKSLIREWGQLIKDSNISLCLAGHDHNMQHLRVEGYGASFIVSGAGGASLYEIKRTDRGFTNEKHRGFNHIHVTPEEVNVQFITADGDCLHHFQRTPTGDVKVLS
jgi:hypothetical protein